MSDKLSLLQVLLYFIFSTRYDDKDYSQKSTLAAALGSVQISQIKGCACKPNLSFFFVCFPLRLAIEAYSSSSSLLQHRAGPGCHQGVCANVHWSRRSVLLFYPFHRKFGLEVKGPDKSYFLWSSSKDGVEVRWNLFRS